MSIFSLAQAYFVVVYWIIFVNFPPIRVCLLRTRTDLSAWTWQAGAVCSACTQNEGGPQTWPPRTKEPELSQESVPWPWATCPPGAGPGGCICGCAWQDVVCVLLHELDFSLGSSYTHHLGCSGYSSAPGSKSPNSAEGISKEMCMFKS